MYKLFLQMLLLLLLSMLSIFGISAQDTDIDTFESPIDIQAQFTLYSNEPVITREPANRYLNGGAIIFYEGEFHMFSNFFANWPGKTVNYYHTSPDGIEWTRVFEEPIFTVDDVPVEGRGALVLSGLVQPDGTWVLYYHTFTSGSRAGFIGRATATAPTGPWIFDEEPVLSPGSKGEWDDLQVMRVNVLPVEDGYVMYYAGVTADGSQIGMATSDDGIVWEKYDDPTTTESPYAESDPIIKPEIDWEGAWLGRPEVVHTDDGWVMLYEGGRSGSQTGLAISEDGVHFSRYALNPILTTDQTVSNHPFFQGALFHHDDTYFYLIESGNGRIGTDIFLFTFEGSMLGDGGSASARLNRPFVFSSHYGGVPAGQWDVANAEAFFSQYPDLETDILRTDYYSSYVNQVIHRQVTDEDVIADVYSASLNGNLREYARQGLIADISDLWQEKGWDEIFPPSVKAMSSVDGKQYFVPQAIQWNGIFYRIDVMEQAGVEPPETWDELLAVCDTLNEAGITPFVIPASPTWPPPMGFWFTHINLRLNGAEFHEQLMEGQISYTDERVKNVFEYWNQLFDHHCFAENATSVTYNQMVRTWNNGGAAMNAHGEWLYEFITDEAKDNTGFIRFPIIDESIPLAELVPMYGAFMMKDTPYPEVSRDFLIQMASVESQTSNMMDINRLPSNLDVDRSMLRPVYEDGLQMVMDAEYLTPLIGSNTHPQIASTLYSIIGNFWRNPDELDMLLKHIEETRQAIYGDVETDSLNLHLYQPTL